MANSEPNLCTDLNLLNVLRELMRHESSLHQPAPEMTRDDIEQMMDADFWEVGASGRRYGRELVLRVLEQRAAQPAEEPWPTWDAHCREIAADNYLLTYTVAQGKRITRRASIWRRTQGRWEIVYHQGTVVEPIS